MHERAVKKRIAFAQQSDRLALPKQHRERLGGFLVEPPDPFPIGGIFRGDFVGHGIFEPKLVAVGSHQGVDDAARIALKPALGKKSNHIDIAHQRGRP